MLEVSVLVQHTRDLLDDTPWETECVGNTGTNLSINVPDSSPWDEGAVGEFLDNGEQFLVRAIPDGDTLTVKRGHNGTQTQIISHPDGTVILRDPVFRYNQIAQSLDHIINQLWPYAYHAVDDTVTPDNQRHWFDLAADVMALISVNQVYGTAPALSLGSYGANGSGRAVLIQRNLPASLVASRVGLSFPGGFFNPSTTINVRYAAKLTTDVTSGEYDDIPDDGLWRDVLAYGASARLLSAKEIPRATQEDTNMGDATVSVGAKQQMGQVYYQMHTRLRNQLQEELKRTEPLMEIWNR